MDREAKKISVGTTDFLETRYIISIILYSRHSVPRENMQKLH